MSQNSPYTTPVHYVLDGDLAPGASVIGDVHVGPRSSIWFGTVVRGDVHAIRIGAGSNVQDNCTVHGFPGSDTVVEADGLVGILTDRDLRNRVVAAGVDTSLPVSQVMSADPATGSADALAFQILMEMTSRNIHHLPILGCDGTPEGVVTTTDLMRLEQTNPIYLVGDITQATDVAAVAEVSKRLAPVVELLVTQDASAEDIGRIVTAVGDAVERRLLGLAEEHLRKTAHDPRLRRRGSRRVGS